ncbi:DUF3299 domain-containing protein [Vibrio wakamikoensis]|uniref:DUF3299 domain-containing protein n=1 Tax=Vibrio wakamikoensis TaxID=2910251 RepID=UPI003D1ADC15
MRVLAWFFAVVSVSGYANDWSWQDLAQEIDAPSYTNHFKDYDIKSRYDLMMVVDYQNSHDDERVVREEDYRQALLRFAEKGVNILALIEEQKEIDEDHSDWNMKVNNDLIGKQGRLPGFIVPLEFDNLTVTEFILVPTAGACIHTPPPPANQMVVVSFPQGVQFRGLYTPVWVEGTLAQQTNSSNIELSDGATDVTTAYTMEAQSVEVYE